MENLFLRKITSGTLEPSKEEFNHFLDCVMQGKTSRQEVSAFLAGLSARPLSSECMLNFISFILDYSPPKVLSGGSGAVNIVGTGGGIKTFNISTAAAIVASAAGAKVLKSGSTAYNSQCGSLDVLQSLQVPMVKSEVELSEMVSELGIGFIPSSHYSKVLQRLAAMIVPLAFRDVAGFINKIGPLLCPYQVSAQVIGVSDYDYLAIYSETISKLKCANTLLVQAEIGLDEFSSIGTNHCQLIDSHTQIFTCLDKLPKINEERISQLSGGDILCNTEILRGILAGRIKGEARDTVALNSGALLYMAGITSSIELGVQCAHQTIDDGKAKWQLERIVNWTSKESDKPALLAKAS